MSKFRKIFLAILTGEIVSKRNSNQTDQKKQSKKISYNTILLFCIVSSIIAALFFAFISYEFIWALIAVIVATVNVVLYLSNNRHGYQN